MINDEARLATSLLGHVSFFPGSMFFSVNFLAATFGGPFTFGPFNVWCELCGRGRTGASPPHATTGCIFLFTGPRAIFRSETANTYLRGVPFPFLIRLPLPVQKDLRIK